MKLIKIINAAAMAAFVLCGSVQAADRIVAVVNDQVITLNQLESRVGLNLRQLNLENAPAMQKEAVKKRTLSGMIDEELQRQYSNKAKIKLTPEDIAEGKAKAVQAVGGEANWNQLTKGYESSANEKLAAEAMWQKIIARDVQPRVQVSVSEADRLIGELAKSRHTLNRQISVIQLNGGDATGDKVQLDKLTEIKGKVDKGENFSDLARVYSEDKSAVNGGNLGWFSTGELNPQLEEALDKMQPGQVSEPIRTPMGWYLVKLENTRTTKPVETGPQTQLELYFLAAPKAADAKAEKELITNLDKATGKLKKVEAVRDYFGKDGFKGQFDSSRALGWVIVDDLDPALADALKDVEPGEWSKPVVVNDTMARVFVADTKQTMPTMLNTYREKVMGNIFNNRVELEARRFMQNLRQRAFLDVRL